MMNAFLRIFLTLIRRLVDGLSDFIFPLFFENRKTRSLPPIKDELLLQSGGSLAGEIRDGRLTSRRIVEAFIQRIEEVNPVINCYVDTRFEEALAEADRVDDLIRKTPSLTDRFKLYEEKPFLGVPFTTKDCFAVNGLSYTAGLLARKGKKAAFDAPSVQNLRHKGGAIPLAVTNVSELCMWMESSNKIYGRSNNPYHNGRIVGGSSGGEAGGLAAAASVIGIGSDIGGSIRMPAFFNGIFGHKPSTGEIVPNKGQLPGAVGKLNDFLSTGPMTRYAEDLLPLFKVLINDEVIIKTKLRLDQRVDVTKLKIYYMEDDGGFPLISPVHQDVKDAQSKLLRGLEKELGVPVTEVHFPEFFYSFAIWSHKMASESKAPSFAAELRELDGTEINPYLELLKWACYNSSNHTLPAIGLTFFQKFFGPRHDDYQMYLDMCDKLQHDLDELLGEDGVLVYPSHPTPAPYHGQPLVKSFNFAYTAIFNVLGNPVTQVPLDFSQKYGGVPIGVQLVGARNQDRNTLALALEVEKLFGGWKQPS